MLEVKLFEIRKSYEARKSKGLNMLAKIVYGDQCLKEETFNFNNNHMI
jgi:hypothetical protein